MKISITDAMRRKALYRTSQWRVSSDGQKARAGQISEFTGITPPYEVPENPELMVNAGVIELESCVQHILGEMVHRGTIQPS